MKKSTAIILSSILLLLTGGIFFWQYKKYQDEQKALGEKANFGGGIVQGGSMLIGSAILFVIVLVGIVVLFVIYGTAKVGKSVAADPDKAIDRTVRASEAYRNVRGGGSRRRYDD